MNKLQRASLYIPLAALTCFTNGVFILTLSTEKRLQTVTNVLLLSLAVADFAVGITTLPMQTIFAFLPTVIRDFHLCLFIHIQSFFFPLVAVFHLLAVTIERYCAIIYPFEYSRLFSIRKQTAVLVTVWCIPILYALFPFMGWNNIQEYFHTDTNTLNISANTSSGEWCLQCMYPAAVPCSLQALINSTLMVIFITMLCLDMRIFWESVRHIRQIRATQPGFRSGTKYRKELKAFWLSMVAVDYFGLSYLPMCVIFTVFCTNEAVTVDPIWGSLSEILAFLHSGVNPLIYGLGCRDIRMAIVKKTRFHICGKKDSIKDNTTPITALT